MQIWREILKHGEMCELQALKNKHYWATSRAIYRACKEKFHMVFINLQWYIHLRVVFIFSNRQGSKP